MDRRCSTADRPLGSPRRVATARRDIATWGTCDDIEHYRVDAFLRAAPAGVRILCERESAHDPMELGGRRRLERFDPLVRDVAWNPHRNHRLAAAPPFRQPNIARASRRGSHLP
jgi:hypothetical protein